MKTTTDADELRFRLLTLSRPYKRLLLYGNDFFVASFSLWLAMSLRLGEIYYPVRFSESLLFLAAPLLVVIGLRYVGLYRRLTRHRSSNGIRRLLLGASFSVLAWSLLAQLTDIKISADGHDVPRSVILIYWLLLWATLGSSRELARWLLLSPQMRNKPRSIKPKRVLIWGCNGATLQFIHQVAKNGEVEIVAILDDDPSLRFQKVDHIKISPTADVTQLIERGEVEEVYVSMGHLPYKERIQILDQLGALPLTVKQLPSFDDLSSGRVKVEEIRPINIEDLLGRPRIPADKNLLSWAVLDKAVMITGAGGSIGSELARQIVRLGPTRLILLDVSEASLYRINSELNRYLAEIEETDSALSLVIEPVVATVCDEAMMRWLIERHGIDIVYHAAAYKHVPLVEANPISGVDNNSLGTWSLARAAKACGVERFVLISTDKAVRPTSIMGASKRIAEMILQAFAAQPDCHTLFTMVRFGNVLNSSGSVVPKFREQIRLGGPVTVTHPDIRRYFMLIEEAVELVIQASALAQQGAVYVLDMGEQIKITDLARTMINLAGKSVRDEMHPNGDIAITICGLFPGEKLHEELLIDGDIVPTSHPRIMHLNESFIPLDQLSKYLADLKNTIRDHDEAGITEMIAKIVAGYHRETASGGDTSSYSNEEEHFKTQSLSAAQSRIR